MSTIRIVLFTRYPTPGVAKTRLIPALGADGAADLHRRLTEATLDQIRASGLPFEVRSTGANGEEFRLWLGPLHFVDQGCGDLGERLENAAAPYPVILVGADAPDLRAHHLLEAAALLEQGRSVVGPAADGGYWLLGLPVCTPGVFKEIPWGTDGVCSETLSRLRAANSMPAMLPILHDFDRPEDIGRWPNLGR